MATQVAPKPQSKQEPVTRGGALTTNGGFPFFLSRMRDEFDKVFDRFFQGMPTFWEGNGWRWGLEVDDQENAVVVRAEAPGFEIGDFDIQVTDNKLILKGAKKVETKNEKEKSHEYREQECYESVTLPPGIDKDKIEAKYLNGVLTVTLPKTAEGKAKKVTVKPG